MLQNILENEFEVYLYFVFGEYLDSNSKYTNVPINDSLKDDIKEICREYVNEIKDYGEVEKYNIIGADDFSIEEYDLNSNFLNIPNINDLFTNSNRLVNIQEEELKKYRYFIIEVVFNNEHFYFIRKPTKPGMLKEGKILSKQRGQYGWIEETDLLAFDDKIDILITNDNIYIFNRVKFEHAYNFSEIYEYLTFNVLENETLRNNIENFEELVIDIGETKTLQKKVANLHNKENVCLFLEQIDITKRINRDYNLKLTFKGNQVIYEDKSQAKHIIAFMQDAYYETYLGKEQGTDTRR